MKIAVFLFLLNIVASVILANTAIGYYTKTDCYKGTHYLRVSLWFKILFYIPCVFSLALYLRSLPFVKWYAIMPWMYTLSLFAIDSILFYYPTKIIRSLNISFRNYIRSILRDCLFAFLPFIVISTSIMILGDVDYKFPLVVFLMVSYNLILPYLAKYKYQDCKETQLDLPDPLKVSLCKYSIYIYKGKEAKSANAEIYGLMPPYKIYVSDYLMSALSQDELIAILYHEMGHIQRHHLLYKGLFITTFYPVLSLVGWLMDSFIPTINIVVGIAIVFFTLIFYCGILFLLLSRFQEYDADRYAVIQCRDKEVFIAALQKLQELNTSLRKQSKLEELLSTHPSTSNRADRIRTTNYDWEDN